MSNLVLAPKWHETPTSLYVDVGKGFGFELVKDVRVLEDGRVAVATVSKTPWGPIESVHRMAPETMHGIKSYVQKYRFLGVVAEVLNPQRVLLPRE